MTSQIQSQHWAKNRTFLFAAGVLGKSSSSVRSEISDRSESGESKSVARPEDPPIGLIAGSGSLPFRFVEEARRNGRGVVAVCHIDETPPEIAEFVDKAVWIKVGELGKLISVFRDSCITEVAMAGGINRVRLFGGVKLDARGLSLMCRIRSAKDDVIMRGVAEELAKEGIEVVASTIFLSQCLAKKGVLTASEPTAEEQGDIEVGREALKAMGAQHIGQLVVVRDGVVVAVEAVEGSDEAIRRGGRLGGAGSVVVKFAKPEQDMRFDVPTVGPKTIETMLEVRARVLALESGRCLILDSEEMFELADKHKISIVGCEPLGNSLG